MPNHHLLCCFPCTNQVRSRAKATHPTPIQHTALQQLNPTESSFMRASIYEKSRFYGLDKPKEANKVKHSKQATYIAGKKAAEYLETIPEGETRYSFSENCGSSYLNTRL